MSFPLSDPSRFQSSEHSLDAGSPWFRLFLAMAVPVLLLLIGISLNR